MMRAPKGASAADGASEPLMHDLENPIDAEKPAQPDTLRFLCINMTYWSKWSQLAFLSSGIIFFFILNGFVEEYTFKSLPEKFSYGMYMTFFELICFAAFAVGERGVGSKEQVLARNAPMIRHFIVAVVMTASRGLTNVSLEYLNYPTQVIFKSAKLVTVMIGSVIILGRSYALLDYVGAICLATAAACFSLGDSSVSASYNTIGVTIVVVSLVADALHSNTQDEIMKKYNATVLETMLYTNLLAALCVLLYILYTGEIWDATAFCTRYPIAYALFVLRALVIYLGVLCFTTTIKRFDVVLATTITTVRKVVTILLSFLVFPKPFSSMYVFGVIAFSIGLYINFYQEKNRPRPAPTTK